MQIKQRSFDSILSVHASEKCFIVVVVFSLEYFSFVLFCFVTASVKNVALH